ncbi:MAG: serine--tRNA ligase, partial [Bacteroidota bacterium]
MIDIVILRDEPARVRQAMLDKGYQETELIDQILQLDTERRETLTKLQEIQTSANGIAKSIGQLFKDGKRDEAEAKKAESS